MNRKETLSTLYGELLDLIACHQIASGQAEQKKKWTYDEVMAME